MNHGAGLVDPGPGRWPGTRAETRPLRGLIAGHRGSCFAPAGEVSDRATVAAEIRGVQCLPTPTPALAPRGSSVSRTNGKHSIQTAKARRDPGHDTGAALGRCLAAGFTASRTCTVRATELASHGADSRGEVRGSDLTRRSSPPHDSTSSTSGPWSFAYRYLRALPVIRRRRSSTHVAARLSRQACDRYRGRDINQQKIRRVRVALRTVTLCVEWTPAHHAGISQRGGFHVRNVVGELAGPWGQFSSALDSAPGPGRIRPSTKRLRWC